MGIQGFYPYVQKHCNAMELVDPQSLAGKRIGIDVAILLHRAKASCSDEWGYLPYIAERAYWLRQKNIHALFMFDGEHPDEKAEENTRRSQARTSQDEKKMLLESQLEEAQCDDEAERLRELIEKKARSCMRVTRCDIQRSRQLLECMGFACYQAEGEAERDLAVLQCNGLIDEIVTEDSDALVVGARSILRYFWDHYSTMGRIPERVKTEDILNGLGLTAEEMRLVGCMAGCDFAPKLPGVGFAKALKAVKKCGACTYEALLALKLPAFAEDVSILERLDKAMTLLSPTGELSYEWPGENAPDMFRFASLVEDVEANGEPGQLMNIQHDFYIRVPVLDIVPSSWNAYVEDENVYVVAEII